MLACERNHLQQFKTLLSQNSGVKKFSLSRGSLLDVVCRNDAADMLEILLCGWVDLRTKNSKCQSLLHIGCIYGSLSVVKALVNAKIFLDSQDVDGRTALHEVE